MRHQTRTALLAFGSGLAIAAGIVAIILWVTNDMRWVLLVGSAGLFGAALWAGSRRRGGIVGLLLLCLPLLLLHAALVVPELPGLWPHLALWLSFALLGWLGFRSPGAPLVGRRSSALVVIAAFGSSDTPLAYIPGAISQLAEPAPGRAGTGDRSRDASRVARIRWNRSRTRCVVLDFFATWCAPCIAELPEIDAINRRYANTHPTSRSS